MGSHVDDSLTESSISAQPSSAKDPSVKSVKLPVRKGPLRPTRGGSLMHGSRGSSQLSNQARTPTQPSGLRYSSTLNTEFSVVIESAAPASIRDPGPPLNGLPDGMTISSPARRGTGRLRKNTSDGNQILISSPRRIGRPPKTVSNDVQTSGNATKGKTGQPSRPRVHLLPASKPEGKRAKADPKVASPKYVAFLCEWRDCKAELHNLETLRKHIYTVHNKLQPFGGLTCQWGRCGVTRETRDKATLLSKVTHENYDFDSIEEFKDHTEKAHLIPYAWHMGDGPRGSTLDGSESDASAYLTDGKGRQVTPLVAGQVVESGSAKLNNARRLAQQKSLIDPSLESLVKLSPALKAGFTVHKGGWEWVE